MTPTQSPGGNGASHLPPSISSSPPLRRIIYAGDERQAANPRATGALVFGAVALVFALITIALRFGVAGGVAALLAIYQGIGGWHYSNNLPRHAGRSRSLTGMLLGLLALGLVIVSLVLQATAPLR
jgi:hypothetical protein